LERREFKYFVHPQRLDGLREAVRSVCERDPNAGPDGRYAIRSLYFDTPMRDLYNANQEERSDRFKLRVRSYPASSDSKVFLELKRRVGDVIVKSRAGVSPDGWATLIREPQRLGDLDQSVGEREAATRFLHRMHRYHLEPAVLVEYDREAFFSTVDDYARVTFDFAVRCQSRRHVDLGANEQGWRPVDHPRRLSLQHSMVIVELKFGSMVPRWMMRLVQRFELIRYAFSKYCFSIEAQELLPEDHVAGRVPHIGGW
jgi:hypothetical protein